MGMFDGLVLRRCLFVLYETLHAILYRYELVLIPSGVSVACLSAADTPGRSIFFGPEHHKTSMIVKSINEYAADVWESSEIAWNVLDASLMIHDESQM